VLAPTVDALYAKICQTAMEFGEICLFWQDLCNFFGYFGDFSMFSISVGYRIWLKMAPHFYM
jgi:hypothetical protein